MTEINREMTLHNLASKFAGGDKDGSREWRRTLLEAVKAGTLEARVAQTAAHGLARRVGNGIASREWAGEFSRPAQTRQVFPITSRYFTPAAVAAWLRLVKIEPPELVRAWLGDALQTAAPKQRGKADVKKEKIRAILGQIEMADPGFSRDAMPGRKIDFQDLCKMLDRASFTVSPDTFSDYLPGLCAFQPGARKSDYYRDIADKLG